MLRNVLLALLAIFLCVLLVEAGYRLIDPFPYYSWEEINHSEHGSLSMYDSLLGWKGVPDSQIVMVSYSNRVTVAHNERGCRDLPLSDHDAAKPRLVFLGDSFTWGDEVEWDEMFVNRVRAELSDYSVFNLAHNGYGTDQSLLTLRNWEGEGELDRVVLMFSENDPDDNNARTRYGKPKPRFELLHFNLTLTGVPVPRQEAWADPAPAVTPESRTVTAAKNVAFSSHFLHDMYYRWRSLSARRAYANRTAAERDLSITSTLLQELDREVRRRRGRLLVVLIPSKAEIDGLTAGEPYQKAIEEICRSHDIEVLDLAPAFHDTWLRTYYRLGMHWNARGHRLAADAILRYFEDAQ